MSALDYNLITAAQVRTNTGRAQGIEDRKLDPAIHDAQDELEQILGETLYEDVETAHTANSTTMGGAGMLNLYTQYIVPFLSWKTLENAYPDMFAEADRNGVFKRSGNDYQSVTGRELAELIAKARNRAERFQQKMMRYLNNLSDTDAIKIAFDETVDDEPRVTHSARANVILKRNAWQSRNPYSTPYRRERREGQ